MIVMVFSIMCAFMALMVREANARNRMHHGKWWLNPRLAEELKLSEKEKKSMEEASLNFRRKAIELKGTLQKEFHYRLNCLIGLG